MKRERISMRDGGPVQVLRPADPEKAIRIANECLAANDRGRMADMLRADKYKLVGYLSESGKLVDARGVPCGELLAGDSLAGGWKEPS